MALTDSNKVQIRRHLGYGPLGNTDSGGSMMGYRFFVHHGLLEYRLNHLTSTEEAVLTGANSSNPSFVDLSTEVTLYGFLPILNFLEGKIGESSDNLDIEKAGEYTARKDEVDVRIKLYSVWVQKLAQYLWLPIAPGNFKLNRAALVN
jgi:hypothetical protein